MADYVLTWVHRVIIMLLCEDERLRGCTGFWEMAGKCNGGLMGIEWLSVV